MTIIYVIYGLIVLAALSVPYRITQRARDNAMLRDLAGSKSSTREKTPAIAATTCASYKPLEILQVEHATTGPALKYTHVSPTMKDDDWLRLRNAAGGHHVYLSYTHADRVACYMNDLGDYVLAEPDEKQKSLLMKQAYIVEKGSVDKVNFQAQNVPYSTGRWKRATTIARPGLGARASVFANSLAFGTPTMTTDGC